MYAIPGILIKKYTVDDTTPPPLKPKAQVLL